MQNTNLEELLEPLLINFLKKMHQALCDKNIYKKGKSCTWMVGR